MISASSLTRKVKPPTEVPPLSIAEATDIAGTLSAPSKMPGYGYGLPAKECQLGDKLRSVKGSTCYGCYALRGNYMFTNVQNAQYARLDSIDNPAWVEAMVTLISAKVDPDEPYFRWHDSGDLQSPYHLAQIAQIASRTPWVKHWLPTREYKIVETYLAMATLPPNLTVRLSAHMIDGTAPEAIGLPVSGVFTDWLAYHAASPNSQPCPAPAQGNACGDCRACWNPEVTHVAYHKH